MLKEEINEDLFWKSEGEIFPYNLSKKEHTYVNIKDFKMLSNDEIVEKAIDLTNGFFAGVAISAVFSGKSLDQKKAIFFYNEKEIDEKFKKDKDKASTVLSIQFKPIEDKIEILNKFCEKARDKKKYSINDSILSFMSDLSKELEEKRTTIDTKKEKKNLKNQRNGEYFTLEGDSDVRIHEDFLKKSELLDSNSEDSDIELDFQGLKKELLSFNDSEVKLNPDLKKEFEELKALLSLNIPKERTI